MPPSPVVIDFMGWNENVEISTNLQSPTFKFFKSSGRPAVISNVIVKSLNRELSVVNRTSSYRPVFLPKILGWDHAEKLIESEDIFDLFRVLSEEQFNNHKKHYNKEYKYQDEEVQ